VVVVVVVVLLLLLVVVGVLRGELVRSWRVGSVSGT